MEQYRYIPTLLPNSADSISRIMDCFNFRGMDYISTQCPQPKVESIGYRKLGHVLPKPEGTRVKGGVLQNTEKGFSPALPVAEVTRRQVRIPPPMPEGFVSNMGMGGN